MLCVIAILCHLPDPVTANHGRRRPYLMKIACREIERILIEDDQVGKITRRKLSKLVFQPGSIGCPYGKAVQGLFEVHALISIPAFLARRSIGTPAGDGGMQAQEWIG